MLNVVSVAEAAEVLTEKYNIVRNTEELPLSECMGRVTAFDIVSKEDVPSFSRSTMDGYAVKASDTYGAGNAIPCMLDIIGEVLMGREAMFKIADGQCVKISTGGMLPEGTDAVIPVEYTDEETGDICLIYKSVSPFENVTKKGDDVVNGEILINGGTMISPVHAGVLAATGHKNITVVKKPVVGIISTGDELADIDDNISIGQVRDINTYLLSSFMIQAGCEPKTYGIVRDDYDKLYDAVKKASEECDVVLVSGGSSAGARDMTAKIISELGEVYIHGLAMKPGKPTIIGKISEKAVFGLPGHPAACYFVTRTLVKKHTDRLLGIKQKERYEICKIAENISSNNGREEYICVKTEDDIAYPLHAKSGIISMLSKADGYIIIDRDSEGIRKNEEVRIYLF